MGYSKPSSEALLIAALVNSQDAEAATSFGVTPEMFSGYQAEYRWVVSYLKAYKTQPSREALLQKFPDFPMSDHSDVWFAAEEVRYAHTKRLLVRSVKSAAMYLAEGDIEEAMMSISEFSPPPPIQPMRNSMLDLSFLDDYHEEIDAMEVPWRTLQANTGGMRKGDLWYLAARLGQGKSWSLGCVIRDAMIAGRNVQFYSLEMPERQVQTRMHVLLGNELGMAVDHISMRDRKLDESRYRKIMGAIAERVPGTLVIHDISHGKVSPASISGRAKEADLVVVDYVGLMTSPLGQRSVDDWRVAAAISNMLKEVAISSDTRVLAAAQINREGDQRGWRPPKVSQLSQSDALGQDADVVLTHKQYGTKAMVYSIEKNRHGASGNIFFTHFQPNFGIFGEVTRDKADEIKSNSEEE